MANRHKRKHGGKMPPMDREYEDVLSKSSHDRKGGKVKHKRHGGHVAHGKKSHERMDKKARGGSIKLKSGGKSGEWALAANSSKQPLTAAAKVTPARG